MQPLDPTKIQAKLNELNTTGEPGAPYWVSPEGMNALTTMASNNGIITFNPNNGIPIKVFVNTRSGEIKMFDARVFTITN